MRPACHLVVNDALRTVERGDRLTVQNVSVDRKLDRVHVELPELAICDQVLVTMKFKDAAGADFSEQVYLTVHAMPE